MMMAAERSKKRSPIRAPIATPAIAPKSPPRDNRAPSRLCIRAWEGVSVAAPRFGLAAGGRAGRPLRLSLDGQKGVWFEVDR